MLTTLEAHSGHEMCSLRLFIAFRIEHEAEDAGEP
jgi:hypothetical protein